MKNVPDKNYREIQTTHTACLALTVWVIKTNQSMLCSEIFAVCSQIHTKHINTLCGQNVECRTYRAVNTLRLSYKNQPVNAVQWNNRCLFSNAHKTNTLCGQNVECTTYRAVNTLRLGYKNQPVNAVEWNNRCLFSDPHKTHKYSVRAERRM